MRLIALILIGLYFLPLGWLHASTADASPPAKVNALLQKLQADLAAVRTTSLVDLTGFRKSPITGTSFSDGWTTYYRYGDVRFRTRQGVGYDITPERDSIAVLRPDAVYLSLTVAPRGAILPANMTTSGIPGVGGRRAIV